MLAFRFPDKPIEATPVWLQSINPREWLCNGKYDGWRCPIYTDEYRKPHLFSRANRPMEDATKVPEHLRSEIARFAMLLPPNSVVDSEFVGPRGGHEPRLFLFDTLAWNGDWQSRTPYEQRWGMLVNAYKAMKSQSVLLTETVTEDFLGYFNRLKKIWYDGGCSTLDLHEGIVVKRRTGTLELSGTSCKKSNHQFKIKYRDVREARW